MKNNSAAVAAVVGLLVATSTCRSDTVAASLVLVAVSVVALPLHIQPASLVLVTVSVVVLPFEMPVEEEPLLPRNRFLPVL